MQRPTAAQPSLSAPPLPEPAPDHPSLEDWGAGAGPSLDAPLGQPGEGLVPDGKGLIDHGLKQRAVGNDQQWRRFCEMADLQQLAEDPRYATNRERVKAYDELRPKIADVLRKRPAAEWIEKLQAAEIPCGPINDVLAAFESPQATARGMSVSVEHPVLGAVRQTGIPFTFSSTPASIRSAPPLLGENADEILAELGYAPEDVTTLREAGAI